MGEFVIDQWIIVTPAKGDTPHQLYNTATRRVIFREETPSSLHEKGEQTVDIYEQPKRRRASSMHKNVLSKTGEDSLHLENPRSEKNLGSITSRCLGMSPRSPPSRGGKLDPRERRKWSLIRIRLILGVKTYHLHE